MENLFMKDCVRTQSGVYVNIKSPKPEMFNIEDIIHSLYKEQRFGNHLHVKYSVLEHLIHCAKLFPDLETLMHDASEFILRDMPSPIKALIPQYKEVEHKVTEAIAKRFGFEYPFPKHVKMADRFLLELEWETFVLKTHKHLPVMSESKAKKEFKLMFDKFS